MGDAGTGVLASLTGVLEQSMDMHLVMDCNGVVEYANPVFESVTGFSLMEMVGKSPAIFRDELCPEGFYAAMWDKLRSGKVFRGVLANRKCSGEVFHDEITISPIRDARGKLRYFLLTGREVDSGAQAATQVQDDMAVREMLLERRWDYQAYGMGLCGTG